MAVVIGVLVVVAFFLLIFLRLHPIPNPAPVRARRDLPARAVDRPEDRG